VEAVADNLMWAKQLGVGEGVSFAPAGLAIILCIHPRLSPWAALFRRSAALGAVAPAKDQKDHVVNVPQGLKPV
jgi:hypothetical protein